MDQSAYDRGQQCFEEGRPKSDVPFNFFRERTKYMRFLDGYYEAKYENGNGEREQEGNQQ